MRIGKFVLLISLLTISYSKLSSQEYNIGIRAGLNFGEYLGPQIPDIEKFSLNNGFHFGINFSYNITDFLALRAEILYNQNGTKYSYEGDGWYFFRDVGEIVRDKSRIDLDISTGGVALPITAHLATLEKFEFYGGAYVNFIFSSIGTGKWIFGPDDEFVDHSFEQGQFHNYRTDESGVATTSFFSQDLIQVRANGVASNVEPTVGAYYLFNSVFDDISIGPNPLNGNRLRSLDYGLILGFNYYLNRGLYLGLRGEYGLRDMTNNRVDYSYQEINDDLTFVFQEDFDRTLNFALSLGFKF